MNKNDSRRGSTLVVATIILSVLMVGSLGYVAWNSFFRPTNETTQLTNNEEVPIVESNLEQTLANGKIVTYPDTEGNRNITFPNTDVDNPTSLYVFISHKVYDKYLASLGETKVDELCGPDDGLRALKDNIVFGLLNTSDKTIIPPQNLNCIEFIASNENQDISLRSTAQETLRTINTDMDAFLKDATIR